MDAKVKFPLRVNRQPCQSHESLLPFVAQLQAEGFKLQDQETDHRSRHVYLLQRDELTWVQVQVEFENFLPPIMGILVVHAAYPENDRLPELFAQLVATANQELVEKTAHQTQ